MHKAIELNKKLLEESINGINKKGYSQLDFTVMSQTLDNIKDIYEIKCYKKDLKENYEEHYEENQNKIEENIEGTEIDDNIRSMNEHFKRYIDYKKEYQLINTEEQKKKCIRELEMLMQCMFDVLKEMKSSSDFKEEREIIKDKLREMFNLY